MRSKYLLVPALAVLFAGTCSAAVVTGLVKYTDGAGTAQPARRVKVEVYALVAGGPPVLVGESRCDTSGAYSVTTAAPPPDTFELATKIYADNDGTSVGAATGGAAYHVLGGSTPPAGGAIAPLTIDTSVVLDAARAFAVADAIQTSWVYGSTMRGAAPAQIRTVFPETGGGTASFYDPSDDTLHIRQWRRYAWDVIGHEYGHHLNDIDDLDDNPGGSHSFGASNITGGVGGKSAGVRLAWGEALGTFHGTAAQSVAPHPTSPTTGDTIYTSLNSDGGAPATFSVNVDTHAGSGDAGEGDEASVVRILWDLADGTGGSEPHDRVTLGFSTMYSIINNDIAGVDELNDLWNHLITRPGVTDATRVDYGAIFEEYKVSPKPMGPMVDGMISTIDPAPTFNWDRQNDGANDTFNLILFDSALSARVLDIAVPGDVTSYTLSAAEWGVLSGSPLGTYKWVVGGSDTFQYTTGSYWSDARGFTLVPTPGVMGLLGLANIVAVRRRR
jgi:hypothetical protein